MKILAGACALFLSGSTLANDVYQCEDRASDDRATIVQLEEHGTEYEVSFELNGISDAGQYFGRWNDIVPDVKELRLAKISSGSTVPRLVLKDFGDENGLELALYENQIYDCTKE